MERIYFATPWDNLVKSMTIGIVALIVSLTIVFVLVIDNLSILAGVLMLYGAVLVLPYLWVPQGYAVADNEIVVKRLVGDMKINVAQKPVRWKWTWWGIRLFGSGGFYGYYGFFSFRGIGIVRMYATNRHNLVLIKDERGKQFLLSPAEPDKFIQLF